MNSMAPPGDDDVVMTPPDLARRIVEHFRPSGYMLDPCRGDGAFFNELERSSLTAYWCEISDGRDFFDFRDRVDWIVTNPPWGSKFKSFLTHSMELANNIVFLANMNVWDTKCRRKLIREAGFGIVEMLEVDTPPPPWPQQGFQLVATWLRRGWTGSTHHSRLS